MSPAPAPPPPIAVPSPLPTIDQALGVWESHLTLSTYGWEQALSPTGPDDPIYPYPRMDWSRLGPPTHRDYRTIVLENGYIRVTVLPEIGGRILRWEDKASGRLLTYANPVIKPVNGWGYRGWWLATGGLEWAFPTEEHGLNEYRPWSYRVLSGDGWRGVRVWDTDDRTGLTVEVTLKVFAGRSDLFIIPRIANPTDTAQPFQFWINAMLTLSGGPRPTAGLRFWVPTDRMIVHSTGDSSPPGPGETIPWPVYDGRDFSRYGEWQTYLGPFAVSSAGVVGAYDEAVDQGLVRLYPAGTARGVKIFCLGDLPPSLYTDDGGAYFELWGGYTRTFWEYATLQPGEAVTWEERWYPVHGIGGLSWAGADLAAALQGTGEGVSVGLYAPAQVSVHLVLQQGGATVADGDVTVGPGRPFRAIYPGSGGGWELQIWRGETLLGRVVP